MTSETIRDKPTMASLALFALLLAIGACYLASLAYFFRNSTNFIEQSGIATSTQAVAAMRSAFPATYTFDAKSPWTKGLAYGWNAPEAWGVWASNAAAAVVLPAIPANHSNPVCVAIRFGNAWKKHRLPLTVNVNGHLLGSPTVYSGQGPFETRGMVPIAAHQPVLIRFRGPPPVIPHAVSHANMDGRTLSFSLFAITIETKC